MNKILMNQVPVKRLGIIWVTLCLLLMAPWLSAESWTQKTASGKFEVTLKPQSGPYIIGDYHNWVLVLRDESGQPVTNANMSLSGGMVGHGHGMPSQPQVRYIDNDQSYLIEGMLFSMSGEWTLIVVIQTATGNDKVRFDINLEF